MFGDDPMHDYFESRHDILVRLLEARGASKAAIDALGPGVIPWAYYQPSPDKKPMDGRFFRQEQFRNFLISVGRRETKETIEQLARLGDIQPGYMWWLLYDMHRQAGAATDRIKPEMHVRKRPLAEATANRMSLVVQKLESWRNCLPKAEDAYQREDPSRQAVDDALRKGADYRVALEALVPEKPFWCKMLGLYESAGDATLVAMGRQSAIAGLVVIVEALTGKPHETLIGVLGETTFRDSNFKTKGAVLRARDTLLKQRGF